MSAGKDNTVDHPVATLTRSQSDAVVAVLAGAAAVDGMFGTEEARRLDEVLARARWVLGLSRIESLRPRRAGSI
jgi:hypothetical protein